VVVVKLVRERPPEPVELPDWDVAIGTEDHAQKEAGATTREGDALPREPYRMRQFEHPVDLLVVAASSWLIRFMREGLGLTPNHVTALSIVASAVSLTYLWQGRLRPFVVAGVIAYWFDDLDGAMARRYRMGTKLGEYLDHLSDLAFFVGIVLVLAFRYGAFRRCPWLMGALLVSALVPATHNACAARACGNDEGSIGVVADIMCPVDRDDSAHTSMRLRWFGGPGYQVVLFLLVSLIAQLCSRAPRSVAASSPGAHHASDGEAAPFCNFVAPQSC
jgi:phosphatidylglycerophosphate synthase